MGGLDGMIFENENFERFVTWLFTIVLVWVELKLNKFSWLLNEIKIHVNK